MRQQTGKLEIRLATIDEFLFAIGDGLGRVCGWRQIERLGVLQISGDPSNAEAKGASQHRH